MGLGGLSRHAGMWVWAVHPTTCPTLELWMSALHSGRFGRGGVLEIIGLTWSLVVHMEIWRLLLFLILSLSGWRAAISDEIVKSNILFYFDRAGATMAQVP